MGAALAVALSGCAGSAPPLTVYGGLIDRCVENRTSDEGFMALVGTTVVNESPRSVILRDVDPVRLINASIAEISVVPLTAPEVGFGLAPGGELTPDQLALWRERQPLNGTVIGPFQAVSIVLHLHAADYREYAGIEGLRVQYDDGWFSTTSTSETEVGFVAPCPHCGAR